MRLQRQLVPLEKKKILPIHNTLARLGSIVLLLQSETLSETILRLALPRLPKSKIPLKTGRTRF